MAITLKNTKRTTGDLRAEYVAAHKGTTAALEKVLREMIDAHRVEYQRHIANMLVHDVTVFLELRKENQTPEDYYIDRTEYGMVKIMQQESAREMTELLGILTDYKAKDREKDEWDGRAGFYIRPNFPIKFKKNRDKLAYDFAAAAVVRTVQMFISRTNDKLVDIMVAHPNYTATLTRGGFSSGVYEAVIHLEFKHPKTFKASSTSLDVQLSLKYNRSKHNKHFAQYPLLFKNYRQDGKVVLPAFSEEEGRTEYDVKTWVAPVQPKKVWTKVKIGCVIRTNDVMVDDKLNNQLGLVTGTRGNEAQVLMYNDKRVSLDEKRIAAIVANISGRETYVGEGPHRGFYEKQDGTHGRMDVEQSEIPKQEKYGKTEGLVREYVFRKLIKEGTLKCSI